MQRGLVGLRLRVVYFAFRLLLWALSILPVSTSAWNNRHACYLRDPFRLQNTRAGREDCEEDDIGSLATSMEDEPLETSSRAASEEDHIDSLATIMEEKPEEISCKAASEDEITKQPEIVQGSIRRGNLSAARQPSPYVFRRIRPRSTRMITQRDGPPSSPLLPRTRPRSTPVITGQDGPPRSMFLGHTYASSSRYVSKASCHRILSSSEVLGDNIYRYTPLGAEEFRLVKVLAANRLDTFRVKCEILHTPFGDPPSYIAISYAWGDPLDTTKILIRDMRSPAFVEVRISKSLYHGLEALRMEDEDLLVWADALSIDQENSDEKNVQLSLMADIYKKARYTAVWLGPEADDSDLATALLGKVANVDMTGADNTQIRSIVSSGVQDKSLTALAALFEREYWNRLWIVQEIFNAYDIKVYCGSSEPLSWKDYQTASHIFQQYKKDLESLFPRTHSIASHKQYSYSQILAYSGPGSLPELGSLWVLGDEAFLEALRVCRRKSSSDPRDKVFGVLGVLGEEVRKEFAVDYEKTVKDVYTDVVDFLVRTTGRLDVICEAIHFPVHTSSVNLPTWVPDWSHIPATSSIALFPGTDFSASGDASASDWFLSQRRSRLNISAIPLGSVSRHGIPVGTLCTLQDYLMAFLNWRALFLDAVELKLTYSDQENFCETICFRQIPLEWKVKGRQAWMEACLHIFACLIKERLPRLAIDAELESYAGAKVEVEQKDNRRFLQDHFGSRMMGRSFCLTSEGRMGVGTGFMAPYDEVVVPLGCSTPVLLRPEGNCGEYRFVGDIYIDGYMHGEAMDDRDSNGRRVKRYIVH